MVACKEIECNNVSRKRGWCNSHYQLIWRRGRLEKKFERYGPNFSIEEKLKLRSKFNPDNGCIEWNNPHSTGYGYTFVDGKRRGAHIVSWEINNKLSASGNIVMHKCDNRRCINPDHLALGNNSLNQKDKVLKGRQAKGTDFKDAKLNEEKIKEIFALSSKGQCQYQIAEKLNVHRSHISNVLNRKVWKHVEVSL